MRIYEILGHSPINIEDETDQAWISEIGEIVKILVLPRIKKGEKTQT